MMRSVAKIALAIGAAALLGGCNPFKKGEVKTPVIGERISVLTGETDIEIDEATAAMPFSLPAAVANEEWTQSGGNASKSMGHVALGGSLGTAWSVSIGEGNNRSARLASAPVIGAGRVYTIDTVGTVRAFDVRNGGQVWSSSFGADINRDSNYGGGVAFSDGRVYAANGTGYVAALDAATGGAAWTVKPGGPLRGAPAVAEGNVYVMSQDNQIYSLKVADGAQNWSSAAALEIAGVFGSASPSVAAVQSVESPPSSARSTAGVRSSTAMPSVSVNSVVRPLTSSAVPRAAVRRSGGTVARTRAPAPARAHPRPGGRPPTG